MDGEQSIKLKENFRYDTSNNFKSNKVIFLRKDKKLQIKKRLYEQFTVSVLPKIKDVFAENIEMKRKNICDSNNDLLYYMKSNTTRISSRDPIVNSNRVSSRNLVQVNTNHTSNSNRVSSRNLVQVNTNHTSNSNQVSSRNLVQVNTNHISNQISSKNLAHLNTNHTSNQISSRNLAQLNTNHSSNSNQVSSRNLVQVNTNDTSNQISSRNLAQVTSSKSRNSILQSNTTIFLENKSSKNINKSFVRIKKFKDFISSCNNEVDHSKIVNKDIKNRIATFNQLICDKKSKNKDQDLINYLKESDRNLKPIFKNKTTFIYGNNGKPQIFSENTEHILDQSKKISIMADEGAFKFRDILTKKYGIKINKNFDFKNEKKKDILKIRDDKIEDNHEKIIKILYKTTLLRKKKLV